MELLRKFGDFQRLFDNSVDTSCYRANVFRKAIFQNDLAKKEKKRVFCKKVVRNFFWQFNRKIRAIEFIFSKVASCRQPENICYCNFLASERGVSKTCQTSTMERFSEIVHGL